MRFVDRLRIVTLRSIRRKSPPPLTADAGSRARGYVERIESSPAEISLSGWIFQPGHPLDAIRVRLNGCDLATTRSRRDDVAVSFPLVVEASNSGFACRAPLPAPGADGWVDVEVVGFEGEGEVARLSTRWRRDFKDGLPEPPEALRYRVTSLHDPMPYWTGALQTFSEFSAAIRKHARTTPRRILDWGCGCGRVTSLFLKHASNAEIEIHGCDIDRDASTWCATNLPAGRFTTIEPHPPTPYPDARFDVVLSYSVFTHLGRDDQTAWLREMRRILAPGGLLLASVHGEFAAYFTKKRHVARALARDGFSDATPDPNLAAVAPEGYYRCVYQTKAQVLHEWSRHLDVVEYVERGMSGYQDLVVLRRP